MSLVPYVTLLIMSWEYQSACYSDGRELKSFEYSEWMICKTLRVIIVYCRPHLPQYQVLFYILLGVFFPLAEYSFVFGTFAYYGRL